MTADAYLFVVLETILVLVCLLAANDGTPEWFDFLREWELRDICACHYLLFPQSLCQLALVIVTHFLEVVVRRLQLLLCKAAAMFAKKPLAGLVYGTVVTRHAAGSIVNVSEIHSRQSWHSRYAHHRLPVVIREIHVKLSRCARMGRLGRRHTVRVLHGSRSKRRGVDGGDCRVSLRAKLLRCGGCSWCRGAQALMLVHRVGKVYIQWRELALVLVKLRMMLLRRERRGGLVDWCKPIHMAHVVHIHALEGI